MSIYFVRHGIALEKRFDSNRSLSKEGRIEVETVANYLKKMNVVVNNIYHSGKTRAKETAEIIAPFIGNGNINYISLMNPNDDIKEFAKFLDNNTMYVGHLPHLEKLISYLIIGNENKSILRLGNSEVVCVEKDYSHFYIKWYLKPSICFF